MSRDGVPAGPPQGLMVRNMLVLFLGQGLGMSGPPIVILLGGIIGARLAPTPALATLPVALMVVGVAVATVPAAMLARRFGRRLAFVCGALVAASAAGLAALAVSQDSFAGLCAACAVLGLNGALVQQYRFAAMESAPAEAAGKAVAIVLVGGMLGGLLGPEVAGRTQHLMPVAYVGSFLALAAIAVVAAGILSFLQPPEPTGAADGAPASATEAVASRQPWADLAVAMVSAAVAYAVMSFIMTGTPLSMHGHGFGMQPTASVIQSHIVAMYLPSLMTGWVLKRAGVVRVMLGGCGIMLASVAVASSGTTLSHYWVALVLLGLGWNLLFVGATVLVARSARGSARFRVQARNDFVVFGSQALASLSAGTVLAVAGWRALNLAALVPVVLIAVALAVRGRSLTVEPPLPGALPEVVRT